MPISPDFTIGGKKNTPQGKIEEGIYTAEINDLTYIPAEKNMYGKEQLAVKFKIIGGSFNGFELRSWVTLAFNAGWEGGNPSGLYLLACAAMGKELNDQEEFNPNELIGKQVTLVVENRRNSKGQEMSKITKYLKSKSSQVENEEDIAELKDDGR